jgi:hypothetical protein
MEWTRRGSRKETTGRKVALVEPPELVSTEEPRPATAGTEAAGRRRASRRLKLLAGLLSRGKGDVID